jgi:hypothetical protein
VVFKVASTALAHLEHARELRPTVPTAALPVLLPAVPAHVFLSALQRCGFDPFHPSLLPGSRQHAARTLWVQALLRWHVWNGTY